MIFRDLVGLKLPDICLTGEEKPQRNLIQETCPDRGSNPGLKLPDICLTGEEKPRRNLTQETCPDRGSNPGLKLSDICLTGEEKPRRNLTQETCPDRRSNPGPLRDRRACYRVFHSGRVYKIITLMN